MVFAVSLYASFRTRDGFLRGYPSELETIGPLTWICLCDGEGSLAGRLDEGEHSTTISTRHPKISMTPGSSDLTSLFNFVKIHQDYGSRPPTTIQHSQPFDFVHTWSIIATSVPLGLYNLDAVTVHAMCTYYYLHYHHVAPCNKGIEYSVEYVFCPNATVETFSPHSRLSDSNNNNNINPSPTSTSPLRPRGTNEQQQEEPHFIQQPCQSLTYAPEYHHNPASGVVFDHGYYAAPESPCATGTGGCLLSQHCVSGGCRLDDLGGRWWCCRCGRGGNTFRWCVHRVRKVPDALCYHVVCRGCRAD
ncbi:hypothetical protein F5Y08DRAFT_347532 [Xylaria arbuscula]|nr:hypothetical protein F5Y08DRAFT_347532 [Xylaria arbuscula]